MNELLLQFNAAGIRYLLIGGQAMRLTGMPRFSMDWDFFIPPRDPKRLTSLNRLSKQELDAPLVPLGPKGENFIQTYQTRWGVLQFHLGLRAFRALMRRNGPVSPAKRNKELRQNVFRGRTCLPPSEPPTGHRIEPDIEFLSELQRLGKLT